MKHNETREFSIKKQHNAVKESYRLVNLLLKGTIPFKHILKQKDTGCIILILQGVLNSILHSNWKKRAATVASDTFLYNDTTFTLSGFSSLTSLRAVNNILLDTVSTLMFTLIYIISVKNPSGSLNGVPTGLW